MLRTTSNSLISRGRALPQGRLHQDDGFFSGVTSPTSKIDNTVSPLSEAEKSHIYNEWVASGKPHNIVCSECRNPDRLMFCETCCRSYHASCLTTPYAPVSPIQFHCPACKEKQWDHSPPRFGSIASSNVSRASTPGVQVSSPPSSFTPCSSTAVAPTPLKRPPNLESSTHHGFPTASGSLKNAEDLSRAREFLTTYGRFPVSQEFPLELLLRLESMMTELESHQLLQQQNEELRAENRNLQKDNANFRAYFGANLPTGKPIVTPTSNVSSSIPRPSFDTSGKSWDRIVMDLI